MVRAVWHVPTGIWPQPENGRLCRCSIVPPRTVGPDFRFEADQGRASVGRVPSYLVGTFPARVAGDRQACERQELRADRGDHRALAAVRSNRIGRFKSHGSRGVARRWGRPAAAFVAIVFALTAVDAATAAPE